MTASTNSPKGLSRSDTNFPSTVAASPEIFGVSDTINQGTNRETQLFAHGSYTSEVQEICLSQISILLLSGTSESIPSRFDQIQFILANSRESLYRDYIQKLITLASIGSGDSKSSTVKSFLRLEFEKVAQTLGSLDQFLDATKQAFRALYKDTSDPSESILLFIEDHVSDPILKFILIASILPDLSAAKSYIAASQSAVFHCLGHKDPSKFNYTRLFDFCLNCPAYPLSAKLLLLQSLDSVKSLAFVEKFKKDLQNMSFRDILFDSDALILFPDKFLSSILSLKHEDLDENIALILAEVLIPGSQNVGSSRSSHSALTASSVPESNAKGAQLQTCFKKVEVDGNLKINWYQVFSHVYEKLYEASKRDIQPSLASITEICAALDFEYGVLDIFLSYEWWFGTTLVAHLHAMHPLNHSLSIETQGSYNLLQLKNLALCFPQTGQAPNVNFPNHIVKFVSVAKLLVLAMAKISSQFAGNNVSEVFGAVRQAFEYSTTNNAAYLLVACFLTVDKSEFHIRLIGSLFTQLMDQEGADQASLASLIARLAEIDKAMLVKHIAEYYTERQLAETVPKILTLTSAGSMTDEIIADLFKVSIKVGLVFTFDGAGFGVNFKNVIEQQLQKEGQKKLIYQLMLEILELRSAQDYEWQQQQQAHGGAAQPQLADRKMLTLPLVFYVLEKLKASNGLIDAERLKNLQLLLLTTYPRLINFGCGHDAAILANSERYSTFPSDVEQEMKSYYSKMYNKEMEIRDIVDMLVRMRLSDNPHDQDIFACMIHSLLDEYRFFSEYPLTALASTSLLFGALLQKDLIQGTTLTVALNFIWESCNQPQDSHLFKFAVQALYNFKSRLHEYPIYCKHLLECQPLAGHAKIYAIVRDAANGIPCTDGSTQDAKGTDGTSSPSVRAPMLRYQSLNIHDDRITDAASQPPEQVRDQLLFFVNNLTSENLAKKLPDVKSALEERYFLWFARYLVVDRAKSEPNNHELYGTFISAFDNSDFTDIVLGVTLSEVERMLSSSKDSSNDRTHLKNMGSWIGRLTLANDKPLRRDQVALKFLLVEGFDFNTLALVIPFVCKILDQAQYSVILRPPNPWILGVIKVLVELYSCADLKLNLKFEIEVLLNSFGMKIGDIEPSTLVRSHNPDPAALAEIFGRRMGATGLSKDLARMSLESKKLEQQQLRQHIMAQNDLSKVMPPSTSGPPPGFTSNSVGAPIGGAPSAPPSGQLDTSFSNLVGNTIFTQSPNLRRAFQASLSRSVRECAVPILSRVSEAVLTTTEALATKDFATEGDPTIFRKSYQTLAQQLCHSMVVCSGRKILSETIEATMLQLLGNQATASDFPINELAVAIQSNVHFCVEIVDKIAAGNISELIDERMQRFVIQREQRNPQEPYREEGSSDYALNLPHPLGLRREGLAPGQLKIYESFGNNGPNLRPEELRQSQPIGDVRAMPDGSDIPSVAPGAGVGSGIQAMGPTPTSSSTAPVGPMEEFPLEQLFVAITQSCERAIELLADAKETRLSELSPEHPIMVALAQALTLAQSNALKNPELLLKVAQYAVNCLFTQAHENPMSNEIYVVILDKLCEYSPSTAKDVTWWLVHSSDQRKFNIPVIYSLLKVQLVLASKLDTSIGKLLAESSNPMAVKFAANLLLNVFGSSEARPIAMRSDFGFTLEALNNYKGDPKDALAEQKEALLARDNLFSLLNQTTAPTQFGDHDAYHQMGYLFAEWIALLSHGPPSEPLQDKFINGLLDAEILSNPKLFKTFFKAATEISVTAFATEHEVRTRTQRESYLAVDSLAMLIVRIVLSFDKNHSEEAMDYLKNIMSVVTTMLTIDHENFQNNWNERAYFKIFSSILCMWNDASILDSTATAHLDEEFYTFIGDIFNSLQPLIYPGFTFAWISLIAHRMFLPRVITLPNRSGYPTMVRLLQNLLKFDRICGNSDNDSYDIVNVIFKAINRIFTGLAHDYPEFLVECHFQLVTAIPSRYIQLRNIVVSATPKKIPVIDPFTQGLKVERLPEIKEPPIVYFNPGDDLAKVGLRKPVDNFLRIPAPSLIRTMYNSVKLLQPKEDRDFGFDIIHYNTKLINALVLHIGISAVSERTSSSQRGGFNVKSTHVSLLVDLMNHGLLEFKFHLINAIANQLRYPNSHTHWFVGIILHFFSSTTIWTQPGSKAVVQEIITRVLLERHIVNKPHPWGLTIVFTELVKNGDYGFFELPFVRTAEPELRVVFAALARNVKGTPVE